MLLPNFKSQLSFLQQGVANKQLLKNLSSEPRKQMQSVSPRRITNFSFASQAVCVASYGKTSFRHAYFLN